jgi:hypothetical protein
VILATLLVTTGGCTPWYRLEVDRDGHQHAVQASGDSHDHEGPAAALYYSMVIDLRVAPPFTVIFPDGFRALSTSIDDVLVRQHLEGTKVPQDEQHPATSWMAFQTDRGGKAVALDLYACRHVFRSLFATVDGSETFDFPLTQSEIERLFGAPARVISSWAVNKYSCI